MRVFTLCLTALLLPGSLSAAVKPSGPTRAVDPCKQCERRPGIAGNAAGFLITFESGELDDPVSVWGRSFNATGAPTATSQRLNPTTLFDSERGISVTPVANGFIAAYELITPRNESTVFVRNLSKAGVPLGAPVQVNVVDVAAPSDARDPSVSARTDGSFVVAWNHIERPGGVNPPGAPRVMARLFSSALVPLGAPLKLNTSLVAGSRPPSACWDSLGRAVVAFNTIDEVRPFEPSKEGVSVRRLKAPAAAQGAEIKVALPALIEAKTALSCGLNGSFVVAWRSTVAPAEAAGDIVRATYDKNAKRVGAVTRLNLVFADEQSAPAMLHDTSGNLVALWESESNIGRAIRGRRLLANGNADGPEFVVADKPSTTGGRLQLPHLTFVGPKSFVVTWDEGAKDVYYRRYVTP